MPELPEVQTIANNLRPQVTGRRISGARLFWDRTLATPSPQEFQQRITGQEVRGVGRRAKFLILPLSVDTLLFHLRMSGDLRVEPGSTPPLPHDRLVLDLDEGLCLAFNDARKFGRVWLVSDPQSVLQDLGPEPLDPGFTPEEFYQRLQARHRQLKPLLLDQTFLAGLGNIYADEALHLAKLHPLTLSDSLSLQQAGRLLESIRAVLEEGLRQNGSSIDWVYRGGDYQHHFRVYQRNGEPCPVCGTPIVRIVVGQRGTHYCPVCQTPLDQ